MQQMQHRGFYSKVSIKLEFLSEIFSVCYKIATFSSGKLTMPLCEYVSWLSL